VRAARTSGKASAAFICGYTSRSGDYAEEMMGDSMPDLELQDAVEDFDADDLLDAALGFDDATEISAVFRTASQVGSAKYTLPTSDDQDAPEVTCFLTEEFPDERVTSASRTVGHGLRPVVPAGQLEDDDDVPNVVVRIEI
jgi:hypothetical protein